VLRRGRLATAAIALFFLAGFFSPSAAIAAGHHSSAGVERQKVLEAVESRTGDGKTLERMREKLGILDGRNLRIAAALCERISGDDRSVAADIAYSLVTALILFG
jgi:hypothetical protein